MTHLDPLRKSISSNPLKHELSSAHKQVIDHHWSNHCASLLIFHHNYFFTGSEATIDHPVCQCLSQPDPIYDIYGPGVTWCFFFKSCSSNSFIATSIAPHRGSIGSIAWTLGIPRPWPHPRSPGTACGPGVGWYFFNLGWESGISLWHTMTLHIHTYTYIYVSIMLKSREGQGFTVLG